MHDNFNLHLSNVAISGKALSMRPEGVFDTWCADEWIWAWPAPPALSMRTEGVFDM